MAAHSSAYDRVLAARLGLAAGAHARAPATLSGSVRHAQGRAYRRDRARLRRRRHAVARPSSMTRRLRCLDGMDESPQIDEPGSTDGYNIDGRGRKGANMDLPIRFPSEDRGRRRSVPNFALSAAEQVLVLDEMFHLYHFSPGESAKLKAARPTSPARTDPHSRTAVKSIVETPSMNDSAMWSGG